MKKFLIVIAAGYGLLVVAFFLMAQMGHKAKEGTSKPLKNTSSAVSSDAGKKTAGQGLSEHANPGNLKSSAAPMAKPAVSAALKNFRTYYSDGRMSSSWSFKGGVLEGTVLLYHPNGAVWMEIPFTDGQETGFEKEYDSSGRLLFEKQLLAGTPQGEVKQYYANSHLLMHAVLTRGSFETLPELFSENGVALGAPSSAASGGGVFRVLSETGTPKAEWSASSSDGGNVAKTFFEDGKVSSEWPVKDGRPHGTVRFFHPGGALLREVPLEEGQLSGKVCTYYAGGALQRETPYQGGRKEGAARIFYEDGSLWVELFFKEGRLAAYPKAYSQGKSDALLAQAA